MSEENRSAPHVTAVAVVGASAGGLEALTEMLSRIEPGSRTAYVVVQHLAADQKSMLDELLQTHCAVPVAQIVDGEPIRGGRVYVGPPGRLIEIEESSLSLTVRERRAGLFRPIDHCFESLARSHGRHGYCVVLSGTGSDGAGGLRAVKEAGGVCFAQESATARFPGMPDAAVATGLVDFVLPASEIVARLEEIVHHRRLVDDAALRTGLRQEIEAALPRLTAALRDAPGHDFSDYKPGTMIRRIERRMNLRQLTDVDRFVEIIQENEEEAGLLAQDFLIGVTQFFRDPDAFAALRETVIGPILDGEGTTVRVWVPGCSTGEEAYSLAILFHEEMERRNQRRTLQIFGTDIDGHALATARSGRYAPSAVSGMGAERLDRFFQPEDGQMRARGVLRESCVFAPHNMVQDPPFSRLDLISCRNLMIYLSSALQKRVLPRFHFSLRPSGFLFLGPSEGLAGDEHLFDTIDKTHRIFQRNDAADTSYSSLSDLVPKAGTTHVPRQVAPIAGDFPVLSSRELRAEREFLRRHAAPFAVIARSGEIRYLSEAMTAFARPAKGAPSNQVDALLSPELRAPVRSGLQAAEETGEEQVLSGIVMPTNGTTKMFDIAISPMHGGGEEYMLVLTEVRATDAEGIDAVVGQRAEADRDSLATENLRLRRQLATITQDQETSSQELKSSNEELMSMNEELQSSNEELETSREELQSINEELETVNAELRENNRALVRANSDLKNLFESTDLAVLFLDRAFGVRNFTPSVADLYGLKARDIGRPITDLRAHIDYTDLQADAASVDATLQPVEREVRVAATDETFLLRMKPYRTTDDRLDGYVLSFVDITRRKQNETALERNRQDLARQYAELENLYNTTPVGLSLVDRDLRYVRINATLAEMNGIPAADHIGRSFAELLPETADLMEARYRKVFETGEPITGFAVDTSLPSDPDRARNFVVDLFPVFVEGEVVNVGTCVTEVTEQRRLMAELAESEARMKRLFDAAPVLIAVTEGPDHVYTYANPGHDRILGNRPLVGKSVLEAIPELEGQGVIERFDEVMRSGRSHAFPEFSATFDRHGDGNPVTGWFSQQIEPVYDGEGRVIGCVTFAYEITDQVAARKAAEEGAAQKTMLLAELQHRVKNMLAKVQAISRLLLDRSESAAAFHDRLSARLGAMARSHDLLTESDWTSASLLAVIEAEAKPFGPGAYGRVVVTGDGVQLDSKEAMTFGMALHELLTNAAQYGALSNDSGRVEIDIGREAETRRLSWREIGGPPLSDADPPRGFGTVVVERILVSDAKASVTLEFEEEGLHFEAVF